MTLRIGDVLHLLGELGVRQASRGLWRARAEAARRRGRRLHERPANRVADEVVHPTAVAKAHLGFRGVDVDVHLLGVAVEKQQREWEAPGGMRL